MCLPKAPKPPPAPTREVSVSQEDAVNTQLAQEKKRRGFASTIATGGQGLTTAPTTSKTQLGI